MGLSHPTVSALIAEEAARRRKTNDVHRMKSVAMKMKTVERMWQELDGSPSAHAVAQSGHAVRGLLADIDMVVRTRAPAAIHHKVSYQDISKKFHDQLFPYLNDDELQMLLWLYAKADDKDTRISGDVDVVKMAFEKYSADGRICQEVPLTELVEGVSEDGW